jgi:hypothetical protein
MAEKVEIDIPGVGLIEAKNAATEATLLEILEVLKGTQKDNNKNAKTQISNKQGGGPTFEDIFICKKRVLHHSLSQTRTLRQSTISCI